MSIPKRRLFASFWDLPPPDSPPGHINPKTIWNNSIPDPLWHLPGFPMCHIRNCPTCLFGSHGSCSKTFWDLPPLHSPPGHINPKTIWNKAPQQIAQLFSAVLIAEKAPNTPPQIARWAIPASEMANTYPKIAILAAPVAKMAKYQGSKWQTPVPQRHGTKPRPRPSFPEAGQRPAEG